MIGVHDPKTYDRWTQGVTEADLIGVGWVIAECSGGGKHVVTLCIVRMGGDKCDYLRMLAEFER